MISEETFAEQITTYKLTVRRLNDIADASCIQQTAKRLQGLYFSPTLILPTPDFLYLSKTEMLKEINRVAMLSEQEMKEQGVNVAQDVQQVKLQHIGLLVYHFILLTRLRQDDPEAWDEIDELYGDD